MVLKRVLFENNYCSLYRVRGLDPNNALLVMYVKREDATTQEFQEVCDAYCICVSNIVKSKYNTINKYRLIWDIQNMSLPSLNRIKIMQNCAVRCNEDVVARCSDLTIIVKGVPDMFISFINNFISRYNKIPFKCEKNTLESVIENYTTGYKNNTLNAVSCNS